MQANNLADQLCEISTALEDAVVQTHGELPTRSVTTLLLLRRCAAPSIKFISKQIGLSHSATVRLIDRLENAQLVQRMKRERRHVRVFLTAGGKTKADELAKVRTQAAQTLLARLDDEQCIALSKAFTQIMSGIDRLGSFEDLASLTAGRP
ncbi:MarR family winged helix-turn-helix transcriptional regulator [Pseudovibrio ascidiaceicola]|uniref:MarR family winged helix-turn-helix transcriptional regulator n=1 Tax=Pseudovibrio ascidiaceicola TaxID=285279 RepID=UPI003D36DBED